MLLPEKTSQFFCFGQFVFNMLEDISVKRKVNIMAEHFHLETAVFTFNESYEVFRSNVNRTFTLIYFVCPLEYFFFLFPAFRNKQMQRRGRGVSTDSLPQQRSFPPSAMSESFRHCLLEIFGLLKCCRQPQLPSPLTYSLHRAEGEMIAIIFFSGIETYKSPTSLTEPSKSHIDNVFLSELLSSSKIQSEVESCLVSCSYSLALSSSPPPQVFGS